MFAMTVHLPLCSHGTIHSIDLVGTACRYYALDLNSADCSAEMTGGEPQLLATLHDTVPAGAIYVHPQGSDSNSGSLAKVRVAPV